MLIPRGWSALNPKKAPLGYYYQTPTIIAVITGLESLIDKAPAVPEGVEEIKNIEYLSPAYGNVPTNEILLCYKNTSQCYNFKHNMNIPLYNFYRDNLSYVDYSYNLYNY